LAGVEFPLHRAAKITAATTKIAHSATIGNQAPLDNSTDGPDSHGADRRGFAIQKAAIEVSKCGMFTAAFTSRLIVLKCETKNIMTSIPYQTPRTQK